MYKRTLMIYGLAIALVGGTGLALAEGHRGQGKGHGEDHGQSHGKGQRGDPEERIQRMKEHLNLSDEQVTQMQAIRDSDATRQEKREQMRGVLTDDQRARIEEHRAMRRQQGGGPHSPRGRGPEGSDGEALNRE
jgi:Spy/CpxP family protein refolding chaperone